MHEILNAPRQKPPSDSFPKHLFFKYYRLQFAPISRCINMASFGEADSTAEANFCMFAASNKQNIKWLENLQIKLIGLGWSQNPLQIIFNPVFAVSVLLSVLSKN